MDVAYDLKFNEKCYDTLGNTIGEICQPFYPLSAQTHQ